MPPLLGSCPEMRVYREDTRKGELWVGVAPSGWSPAIWILMKRGSEDCEAKGRGLNTKRYQAQ